MGAELPSENVSELPPIDGVTSGISDCDAVFMTHYHGDHVGLYKKIIRDIPIYIGEVAKEIFLAFCERVRDSGTEIVKKFKTFNALDKITVKDIAVTPILIDHSAFDAYMFLIENRGKRILHTGDFRMHGFRGSKLLATLENYVGVVDVLITEGTMLSRGFENVITERELQIQAKEIMRKNKYVFVLCSSTNIDRIAAFYHANPRGRYFICDEYQRGVLCIVRKYAKDKSPLYNFEKVHTYGINLDEKLKKQGFCMLVRSSDPFKRIMNKFESGLLVYSMWGGYVKGKTQNKTITDFVNSYNSVFLHTSGHATGEAIKMVCDTVRPKVAVIPMHSEKPQNLGALGISYNIKYLEDKEEFDV